MFFFSQLYRNDSSNQYTITPLGNSSSNGVGTCSSTAEDDKKKRQPPPPPPRAKQKLRGEISQDLHHVQQQNSPQLLSPLQQQQHRPHLTLDDGSGGLEANHHDPVTHILASQTENNGGSGGKRNNKRRSDGNGLWGDNYINVDRFFLVAMPILFLVFNVVYWLSYGRHFFLATQEEVAEKY